MKIKRLPTTVVAAITSCWRGMRMSTHRPKAERRTATVAEPNDAITAAAVTRL